MRRANSSKDLRDMEQQPSSLSSSAAAASAAPRSSSLPRSDNYTRSSSAPSKLDEDGVIIEEKRKKANGDGYTLHRYLRGRLLGKGGFAKVYLCTALDTNKMYAIKIVPKANLVKARARQKVRSVQRRRKKKTLTFIFDWMI